MNKPASPDVENEWRNVVEALPASCRERLHRAVSEHANTLADRFYAELMTHEKALAFLSNDIVESRLRHSMARWLTEMFRHPVDSIEALVAQQRHVGEVHARIQVPVHLVARGARAIKSDIRKHLTGLFDDPHELCETAAFASDLIDMALELMSESYERSSHRVAREDEAYRLHSVGQNISVERERQRAVLLEWGQEVMYSLHRVPSPGTLPTLGKSEFGLWFNHKASVLFEGDAEVEEIRRVIARVDTTLLPLLGSTGTRLRSRDEMIVELQAELSSLKYLLSTLFERHLETENGRDTLTRLLNRRFLPAVMNREIQIAQTRRTGFALLLLDIDHFKEVNDQNGHQAGDLVLQQAATLLTNAVRNGDFLFRYGGDEILVMLVEVSEAAALRLADAIRQRFESTELMVGNGKRMQITVSIGVAMYSGHPDHQYLIRRADEALYQAKQEGRNRVKMAD